MPNKPLYTASPKAQYLGNRRSDGDGGQNIRKRKGSNLQRVVGGCCSSNATEVTCLSSSWSDSCYLPACVSLHRKIFLLLSNVNAQKVDYSHDIVEDPVAGESVISTLAG